MSARCLGNLHFKQEIYPFNSRNVINNLCTKVPNILKGRGITVYTAQTRLILGKKNPKGNHRQRRKSRDESQTSNKRILKKVRSDNQSSGTTKKWVTQ
ncbi:hypothetical protein WA026_006329 [Henosepilachna vigintioctopunctata]|uniref:Uncharacterized protein n=1 Tax=Henosepilachna vigintioctopunctata TaxID=420089 RepID=A0AAW1TP92_9CUCU